MSAITATEAKKSLLSLIARVNEDHAVIVIESEKGNAVLLAKADYDSLVETAYLLSSPANARRLMQSLEATRRGEQTERELRE